MTRFFTSDHHFGHENIIKYCDRPFSSADEMDEAMIDLWNDTVGVDDEVYYLGDFSLGGAKVVADILPRLNFGSIVLIVGNHDKVWKKGEIKDSLVQAYRDAGFNYIASYGEIAIDTCYMAMSHYPYAGDHGDKDRYPERRAVDKGMPLLCGHIHEKWKKRGRMVNVGVDAWCGKPVSEHQIATILSNGPQDLDVPKWV